MLTHVRLCDKLQLRKIPGVEMNVVCFLDKQNLPAGKVFFVWPATVRSTPYKEWDLSFLNALDESCLFVPLVSEAAISTIRDLPSDRQVDCSDGLSANDAGQCIARIRDRSGTTRSPTY